MKTKIALYLFLVIFGITKLNAQSTSSEILGTWKLVSFKYGEGETKNADDGIVRLKLITQDHFAFIHYLGKNNIVLESAGGTYTVNGEDYTENIEFGAFTMKCFFDKKQLYKIKIENGRLYLSGVMSDNQKIEEVWEEINPQTN